MNFLLKNSMNIILLSIIIIGTLAVFSGFNDKFSDVPPFNEDNKRVVTVEAFDGENFCKINKHNPKKLLKDCDNLGKTGCPTASCCILLNGKMCVPGDKNGPIYHTKGGEYIENKFYYWKGKCYGNGCSKKK